MSREDARWALGLVVGLGVAVYVGVITWQQALGVLGYFVWFSAMLAAGLALTLVFMALTGVSLELFEWFCKRLPVLGLVVGRVFYGVLSTLILIFAAVVAGHVARDMVGFAWASPGTFVVGLLFFFWFPLGITMTIGTYLYGRYRLPKVYGAEKGFPWSFAFLIAASANEMMQVAFNEWAHSLWIKEEIFAAPFHWPFVFYGWLAAGIFALWAETIIRLLGIEKEVEDTAAAAAAR